jgi:hypothetical protein
LIAHQEISASLHNFEVVRDYSLPNNVHGLRSAVTPTAKLICQLLSDGRLRSVAWECAHMHKDLGTTMRWSNEAEAAVVVPAAQGAGEDHLCEGRDGSALRLTV